VDGSLNKWTDISSRGEMKTSLRLMIYGHRTIDKRPTLQKEGRGTHIFVLNVFEELEFTVRAFAQYRGAERFHNLLDRHRCAR
jgi:hypothetical protein